MSDAPHIASQRNKLKASRVRMAVDGINTATRKVPVWLVYMGGVIPALAVIYAALTGGLGPDPVERLLHEVGLYSLQFFVAVICVTPLRRHMGINLMRFRRALGVLSFIYLALHVAVWLVLDVQFNWGVIFKDILTRPYISVGFIAFVMMVPLAITSNNASVRKLGGVVWRNLHLLTYPAAILAGLHFVLLTKTWQFEPIAYLSAILVLLVSRKGVRDRLVSIARRVSR